MLRRCFALLLVGSLVSLACGDHHEEGFLSLFDGKTLQGWEGKKQFWSVKDGAITGRTTEENPTKGNTFIIWRGGTLDDFELRLQFKMASEKGNSGIQYRSKDRGDFVVSGYQADFEAGDTYSGILYEEKGRGILALRGQMTKVVPGEKKHKVEVIGSLGDTAVINKVIKKQDWNDYKIIASGNSMVHVINGRVTAIVVDQDPQGAAQQGILALQLHAGPPMVVQFKNIRVRPLKGIALVGDWEFDVEINDNVSHPKFRFTQTGGKLGGDYSGLLGTASIQGTQTGNKVRWRFDGDFNGTEISCDYEGELVGFGEMKGTLSLNDGAAEGTFTARRK